MVSMRAWISFACLALHAIGAVAKGAETLDTQYSFRDFFRQVTGLSIGDSLEEPQESILILGAGFSRTGTTSLALALDHLGYKVYDTSAAVPLGGLPLLKQSFLETPGAVRQLRSSILANGYNATLDIPVSLLWKELLALDPRAKVLLTVRDSAQQWYRSYARVLEVFAPLVGLPFTKLVDFTFSPLFQKRFNCVAKWTFWTPEYLPWIHMMYHNEMNEQECMQGYEDWIQDVRKVVPKDQLLIFNVKEGWEPLCKFLGAEIPELPFPRVNTEMDMAIGWYVTRFVAVAYPFLLVAPLGIVYCLGKCCCRKRVKSKHE